VRALLDTSALIGAEDPGDLEGAISAASLAELHFGVLVAADEDERARRALRLGVIESVFAALPIDDAVAREWGRLAAAVTTRGGQPRRCALDLAIAATANVHHVPLLTHNAADFRLVDDLVDVRALQQQRVLERPVRSGVRHPCHPTWMWSRWSARANPRGSLGPSGSQQ
jgi:predicted nucleic acid-binding protein